METSVQCEYPQCSQPQAQSESFCESHRVSYKEKKSLKWAINRARQLSLTAPFLLEEEILENNVKETLL